MWLLFWTYSIGLVEIGYLFGGDDLGYSLTAVLVWYSTGIVVEGIVLLGILREIFVSG